MIPNSFFSQGFLTNELRLMTSVNKAYEGKQHITLHTNDNIIKTLYTTFNPSLDDLIYHEYIYVTIKSNDVRSRPSKTGPDLEPSEPTVKANPFADVDYVIPIEEGFVIKDIYKCLKSKMGNDVGKSVIWNDTLIAKPLLNSNGPSVYKYSQKYQIMEFNKLPETERQLYDKFVEDNKITDLPTANSTILLDNNMSGGRKSPASKPKGPQPSAKRIIVDGRKRVVYVGPKGGKYIKKNGKFVRI